jgi:hypothetical protein
MQARGQYQRVGKNGPLSEFFGFKHNPDIQPDNIGLTAGGRIDMIEIKSRSQTYKELWQKLDDAMRRLPPEKRG